jgi:hypothetical protein
LVDVVEESAEVGDEERGSPEDDVVRDELHGGLLAAKCVLLDVEGKHKI